MKNITKTLFLFCLIMFSLSGRYRVYGQIVTFNWNGTPIVIAGFPQHENGTVQTWTVPSCVNVITVIAAGGAGGGCLSGPGGLGAVITGTVTVAPGDILDIVAAGYGGYGEVDGGGGGGGSYVWDNTTSTILVVAGGGGAEGYIGADPNGPNGQTNNATAATLEAGVPDGVNTCGAAGVGGNGGAPGAGANLGGACGAAGWISDGGLVACCTPYSYTGYGYFPLSGFTPAYGGVADPFFSNPYEGAGGFGGGSGGGYNAGGGGGGYNGAGGGKGIGGVNGDAGGGGGSYCGGGTAISTALGSAGADGYVTIKWVSAGVSVTITAFTNVLCNGGATGSATATPAGGTAPYTYLWNPSAQTNQVATGLSAGSYTVTVKDNHGCTSSASVTLTQPPVLTANIGVPTAPACNGGMGSATATAGGGTPAYTYSWNPGGNTNANATNLTAGSYTVTVKDHNGCTATAAVTITQPSAVTASTSMTLASCGSNNGTATVLPGGGTPAYTYSWNPSGQTTITATGLSAGTYTVTVKDHNGCTATSSILVTSTPGITSVTLNVITNVLCNGGGGGSATVTNVVGGTSPYTYSWNPSAQTNQTATGLSAGTYTVTVKDINGCTATATAVVTQPTALSITTNFTHASCNLPNGTATANVTGGVGAYTYLWVPSGETNATATGLTAGTYTINITDNNHCTASTSVTVTQPSAVAVTVSATTGVSCNGGSNGTATAAATGGSGPYTYLWAPGGNTNAFATGLGAGSYTVTTTDANGCTASAVGTITEPTAIVVSVNGPTLVCQGSTGIFTANASGGTLPYAYSWSSGATTSVASITPTIPQTYTVTITDANGCTATGQINVSFGPPLSVIANSGQNAICSGSSGSICANVSGGTGGDSYLWAPGNLTSACITISPASTTTYTVTVTDNCGATANATTTVNVYQYPVIDFSTDINSGCAPLCIQFRTITSGHAAQYVWSFGNGDTVQSASPIYCYPTSGIYNISLTVTDSGGCSATLKKSGAITVYTRPDVAFTYSPQPISILTPTVQFTDQSKDQYGIVFRRWHFGDATDSTSNSRNPSHTYQDTGNYCANLVVMNSHGCVDTATNCLIVAPAYTLYIPSAFTPNGDGVNDVFLPVGKYIKTFEMYIFDRWGMQLFHTTNITKGWNGTVGGGTNIAQQDTYIYKILVTDSQDAQHSYIGNVNLLK